MTRDPFTAPARRARPTLAVWSSLIALVCVPLALGGVMEGIHGKRAKSDAEAKPRLDLIVRAVDAAGRGVQGAPLELRGTAQRDANPLAEAVAAKDGTAVFPGVESLLEAGGCEGPPVVRPAFPHRAGRERSAAKLDGAYSRITLELPEIGSLVLEIDDAEEGDRLFVRALTPQDAFANSAKAAPRGFFVAIEKGKAKLPFVEIGLTLRVERCGKQGEEAIRATRDVAGPQAAGETLTVKL
jgi:hypothetical protein